MNVLNFILKDDKDIQLVAESCLKSLKMSRNKSSQKITVNHAINHALNHGINHRLHHALHHAINHWSVPAASRAG